MKRLIAILLVSVCGTAAHAELNVESMNTGSGLAQIMSREAKCGYKIDPKALAAYMKSSKMDAPDVLAWISNQKTYQDTQLGSVSAAECAATEAAARGIGIIP